MSDFEEIVPDIYADPCLDGRRRSGFACLRKARETQEKHNRLNSRPGFTLRMSVHEPSLAKLKFMGDE